MTITTACLATLFALGTYAAQQPSPLVLDDHAGFQSIFDGKSLSGLNATNSGVQIRSVRLPPAGDIGNWPPPRFGRPGNPQ